MTTPSKVDELFRVQFAQRIYTAMGSSPESASALIAFGSIIQSCLLTMILSNTVRYYELFRRKDHLSIQLGVGFLSLTACGAFAMHCWQAREMIYNAQNNLVAVFRADAICMWAYILLGGLYSVVAMTFYAFRIWRMAKRRWWVIPPLACCILTALGMLLSTSIWGLGVPELKLANVQTFPKYFERGVSLVRWYGGVTLVADGFMSLTLISLLLGTENSILKLQSERGILHKLIALTLESMLPPVIAIIMILVASFGEVGYLGWMRLPICALPMMYLHSLLFSLSRQTVRDLLDARPIGQYRMDSSNALPLSGGGGVGGTGGGSGIKASNIIASATSSRNGAIGSMEKSKMSSTGDVTLHDHDRSRGSVEGKGEKVIKGENDKEDTQWLPVVHKRDTWTGAIQMGGVYSGSDVKSGRGMGATRLQGDQGEENLDLEKGTRLVKGNSHEINHTEPKERFGEGYQRGGGGWHPFSSGAGAIPVSDACESSPSSRPSRGSGGRVIAIREEWPSTHELIPQNVNQSVSVSATPAPSWSSHDSCDPSSQRMESTESLVGDYEIGRAR